MYLIKIIREITLKGGGNYKEAQKINIYTL